MMKVYVVMDDSDVVEGAFETEQEAKTCVDSLKEEYGDTEYNISAWDVPATNSMVYIARDQDTCGEVQGVFSTKKEARKFAKENGGDWEIYVWDISSQDYDVDCLSY